MKALFVLAITAGSACAQSSFFAVDVKPFEAKYSFGNAESANVERNVLGDTVNWAVTAFDSGGGGFLHAPQIHTVGGSDFSAGSGPVGAVTISSSVSTVANVRTISMSILTDGNTPIMQPGLSFSGVDALNTIFFEIPDLNGGPDLFDDVDKIGAATGSFELLTTGGAVLFGAAAGIVDSGTSFSVGNGVGTGAGTDLFTNVITGGRWEISYAVPTPASAALLGLGGLVAVRRRR